MSRWLYLLILIPLSTAAMADDVTRPMVNPAKVVERGDGWVTLVYPPIALENGDMEPIMLCLRAVRGVMQSAPVVHWAPEGREPRDGDIRRPNGAKRYLALSTVGFVPEGGAPYVTVLAENLTTGSLSVVFKVTVRGE